MEIYGTKHLVCTCSRVSEYLSLARQRADKSRAKQVKIKVGTGVPLLFTVTAAVTYFVTSGCTRR